MHQLSLFTGGSDPLPPAEPGPLTVAYGLGVDSTAILVGLHQAGERPELITFADTGSEKQATYEYLPVISRWLRRVGFPPITVVRYQARNFKHFPPYKSLYENCLSNYTLPSISFGFFRHSCSIKWKLSPQLKFIESWQPARHAWRSGRKVIRCVGYDCSETKRMRKAQNKVPKEQQHLYENRYPLLEWGWGRNECRAAITDAGLPVPPKSACYFCAAMQPEELHDLNRMELRRIITLEQRASEKVQHEGLWFKTTRKRPGSMTTYIRNTGLLPAAEIDSLIEAVPTHELTHEDFPDWDAFEHHITETTTQPTLNHAA